MQDLYLKFESEAQADAALNESVPTAWNDAGEETAWEDRPKYRNIDVIGVIYKPTGEMLQGDDGPYPEMAPIPGWHVNVRVTPGEDAAVLEPYSVEVQSPIRVWG